MHTRAYPGYKKVLARHIEQRLEVVPHARDRNQALQLEAHQRDAMLEVAIALQDEHRYKAFSIVHCCGSGKTVLEANIVGASQDAKSDLGINEDRRDIILTTERALIEVIRNQFGALGFDDLGVWGAGEKILDRPIVLATIQALQHNRRKLGKLLPLDRIDLVIGDEADSYLTGQRKKVIEQLDGALRVGLTATPKWRDGRDISEIWGPKIHEMRLSEGIARGINTPPLWVLYEANLDEDTLKIRSDDYEPKTLAAAMKHAEIHKAIPEIYRAIIPAERRKEFPTLVYVPNTYLVETVASTLKEQFESEGIKVHYWTGETTSTPEQREDIQTFLRGEIQILVLCEMGGRGMDLPAARFLIDAYPTLSPTKLEQRHGRVLRRIREGSPLHQAGFRKDFAVVAQIHPKSNAFRPICLPDILGKEAWEQAVHGKVLGRSGKGLVGPPWLIEVEELQKRIERQKPSIYISLIKQLDVYRKIVRGDELEINPHLKKFYEEDSKGFFHLTTRHGACKAD